MSPTNRLRSGKRRSFISIRLAASARQSLFLANPVWSLLMGRGIVHELGGFENPSAGLTTHHTDARVSVKTPPNGICFVRVGETQNQGSYAQA
ncbi:MAG: hypothetical protein ABF384_00065 [Verrucomicrobiales bacterium]